MATVGVVKPTIIARMRAAILGKAVFVFIVFLL